MSSLLLLSNFTAPGRFHLSINGNNEEGLQAYIDEVQEDILTKLLGCELAKLFIADLSAAVPPIPTNPIYTKIFEPFCLDDCKQIRSEGMLKMLKGLTFWYYFRDNIFKRTTAGPKENAAENSITSSFSRFGLSAFFNDAEESFRAIQYYICNEAPEDYPTYEGIKLGTVSAF